MSSRHCENLFCSGTVQEFHTALIRAILLLEARRPRYSLGRKQAQQVYSSEESKIRVAIALERLLPGARPEATEKLMT